MICREYTKRTSICLGGGDSGDRGDSGDKRGDSYIYYF